MLFNIIYYTVVGFSILGTYYIIRSQKSTNKLIKLGKSLLFLFFASIWMLPILLLIVPKGNKIHEGLRIPPHLWKLDNLILDDTAAYEVYTYGNHPNQYYRYYPATANSKNKQTVIFFIHGGAWCVGSPLQHQYLAKKLHEQGYTVILPAYRFAPEFAYNNLQDDINQALIHSLATLEKAAIPQPQFIFGGTSAGANLASLLVFDEQRWETLQLNRQTLVKGIFSIVGVLDMNKMEHTSTLLNYTGDPTKSGFQIVNPINYINVSDSLPFLCLHGDKDGLAPYSNAVSFCDRLSSFYPNLVTLKTFDNSTHIEVGSAWYYDSTKALGQEKILLDWLNMIISS